MKIGKANLNCNGACICLFFLLYLDSFKQFFGSSLALNIIDLVILILCWCYIVRYMTNGFQIKITDVLIVFWTINCWMSIGWGEHTSGFFLKATNMFKITIYFFTVQYLVTTNNIHFDRDFIVRLLSFNCLIFFLFLLWDYQELYNNFTNGIGRLEISNTKKEVNPIWTARILCDTILGLIIIKPVIKIRTIVILSLLIFFAILTGSKGPILSLLVVLGIWLLVRIFKRTSINHRRWAVAILLLGAVVSVIGIGYLASSKNFSDRFSLHAVLDMAKGSRMDRYTYTLREVKGNIWGHGLGSWGKNYWGDLRAIYDYPHNILLEIAYETGVLQMLLFCVMFVIILKKSIGSYLFYFILLQFLYSMTSGTFAGGNDLLYLYLAFATGISSNRVHLERGNMK